VATPRLADRLAGVVQAKVLIRRGSPNAFRGKEENQRTASRRQDLRAVKKKRKGEVGRSNSCFSFLMLASSELSLMRISRVQEKGSL